MIKVKNNHSILKTIIRHKNLLSLFLISIFIFFSILLFVYSILLKCFDWHETKSVETVSLKFNVPTETDSFGRFWWFNRGNNDFSITNYSNEKRKVKVFLVFQDNPCGNLTSIKLTNVANLKDDLVYNFEETLKPYQTLNYNLEIETQDTCVLKNDSRIFGAKLRNWYLS